MNAGSAMDYHVDVIQGMGPGLGHAQAFDKCHLGTLQALRCSAAQGDAKLNILFLTQARQHAPADKTGRARE